MIKFQTEEPPLTKLSLEAVELFEPVGELDGEDDGGDDGGGEAPGEHQHQDAAPARPTHRRPSRR